MISDLSNTEKEFEATPRRIHKARIQGQLLRSSDLSFAVSSMICVFTVVMFVPVLFLMVQNIILRCLAFQNGLSDLDVVNLLFSAVIDTIYNLAPMLGILSFISTACIILIGGWSFNFETIKPSLKRLSIVAGIKRLVSGASLFEGFKLILTCSSLVVLSIFVFYLFYDLHQYFIKSDMSHVINIFTKGMVFLSIYLATVLIFIGLIDYLYKKYRYFSDLKMSLHEIKQEIKESEVDPRIKNKTRKRVRYCFTK